MVRRVEGVDKTTSANITSPTWKDGKLFFESGANGTNNIYCLHLSDKQVYRLTAARFGAFDPSFSQSGNHLLLLIIKQTDTGLLRYRLTVCYLKRPI